MVEQRPFNFLSKSCRKYFQQLAHILTLPQTAVNSLKTINWTPLWTPLFALVLAVPSFAQNSALNIPIETTNNDMILVPVKIDGHNYVMLLDTGAQNTIIGEAGVGKAKAQDSNKGLVFEAKARLVTVQFNGGPIFKEHILSANLQGFKQRMGNASRVDGILGQDVLRKFALVTIHYKENRLELVLKQATTASPCGCEAENCKGNQI